MVQTPQLELQSLLAEERPPFCLQGQVRWVPSTCADGHRVVPSSWVMWTSSVEHISFEEANCRATSRLPDLVAALPWAAFCGSGGRPPLLLASSAAVSRGSCQLLADLCAPLGFPRLRKLPLYAVIPRSAVECACTQLIASANRFTTSISLWDLHRM